MVSNNGPNGRSKIRRMLGVGGAGERLKRILRRLVSGEVSEASVTFEVIDDGMITILEHVEDEPLGTLPERVP